MECFLFAFNSPIVLSLVSSVVFSFVVTSAFCYAGGVRELMMGFGVGMAGGG